MLLEAIYLYYEGLHALHWEKILEDEVRQLAMITIS
jgi:hypothetical protein